VSDTFQIDSADLEKFRDATREEVRSLVRDFEQASGGETIYVLGLFDYVDWKTGNSMAIWVR
jgi:hypothetical protein